MDRDRYDPHVKSHARLPTALALTLSMAASCAGPTPHNPAAQPAPLSDTIEWSITSNSGTQQVLLGGTLVETHRVTFPAVAVPFHMTTTAPHGTESELVLSVSVFAKDTADCRITVNGGEVASASTNSYATPAVCRWG